MNRLSSVCLLVACAIYVSTCMPQPRAVSNIEDCTYKTASGKEFDMSELRASNGSYMWLVTTYSTNGHGIETMRSLSENSANFYIQLQVCGNVDEPIADSCSSVPVSPVYMISADKKTCLSLGTVEAAIFDENPFKDGIFLTYYHGSAVDHTHTYNTRVYFVCQSNVTITPPYYEHMLKDNYASHMKIFTKYAC